MSDKNSNIVVPVILSPFIKRIYGVDVCKTE